MSKHQFQAEVNQLLTLIIHSLYSHTEIFLRELVSNASDALDKLKYLTLTQEEYKGVPFAPRIDISFDTKDRKTLTVSDTGIGMNEKDLEENLGTIARSGTREFLQAMAADAKKGSSLIGQFGVGFYSVVHGGGHRRGDHAARSATRRRGSGPATARASTRSPRPQRDAAGTTVTLHLNEAGKEYADRWRIEGIIRKYSNHIAFPIHLHYQEEGQHGGKVDKDVPGQLRPGPLAAAEVGAEGRGLQGVLQDPLPRHGGSPALDPSLGGRRAGVHDALLHPLPRALRPVPLRLPARA